MLYCYLFLWKVSSTFHDLLSGQNLKVCKSFHSLPDENLCLMNKLDSVAVLLDAIRNHIRDAKVVKNACMALAAIVEPDGECKV